jgi:hypothetical protein
METILTPSDEPSSPAETMFSGGETFSSSNGEEIAVEALECSSDGKDENCKNCS